MDRRVMAELSARHQAAADEMLYRLRRLIELSSVEHKRYAHWLRQPRVPAGQADGGQWTDGGAGAGMLLRANSEETDLYVAIERNDREYQNELWRPHTIERHVNLGISELIRHANEAYAIARGKDPATRKFGVATRFFNLPTAEQLINDTIRNNRRDVLAWLRGTGYEQLSYDRIVIRSEFKTFTGMGYAVGQTGIQTLQPTWVVVVIQRSRTNPQRFYVWTAYPSLKEPNR